MKWLKAVFVTIFTTIAGMFGGQKEKGTRRFGIFGFALTIDGFSKRAWPLILLIPSLIMGYGENSWLYQKIGVEWLVRFTYAFLLSLSFMFYGFIRWCIACALLIGAFQIHAGSFGYISWFGDLLWEDCVRYLTLGILISYNLFIVNK